MNFQMQILFVFTIITVALGKTYRIVGGSIAQITDYPHQVSIRYYSINEHFCSGSIVSDKHVLSAGHCFYQKEDTYSDIRVFVGSNSPYATDGTRFPIYNVDIHPQYTGKITKNEAWIFDVAVLTIRGSFTFGSSVNKIPLPTQDIQTGSSVIITGYGKTSHESYVLSDKLQKATMRVIDTTTCSENLKRTIQNTQSCLLQGAGIGGCHGDSGGPVVMGGNLVGIQGWVIPCAQGHPDVITKVYPHLQFINSIITH